MYIRKIGLWELWRNNCRCKVYICRVYVLYNCCCGRPGILQCINYAKHAPPFQKTSGKKFSSHINDRATANGKLQRTARKSGEGTGGLGCEGSEFQIIRTPPHQPFEASCDSKGCCWGGFWNFGNNARDTEDTPLFFSIFLFWPSDILILIWFESFWLRSWMSVLCRHSYSTTLEIEIFLTSAISASLLSKTTKDKDKDKEDWLAGFAWFTVRRCCTWAR